jgi:PGDYG protein
MPVVQCIHPSPVSPMQKLKHVDLAHDPSASTFVKDEIVTVVFAERGGEIMSGVGLNRYRRGDALITGVTGDSWSVSRDRFDAKYEPVDGAAMGADGRYRAKRVAVLAKQMPVAFSIERSEGGDTLEGEAGDWLLQYAPGDFGVVAMARFVRVYRREE